MALGLRLKGRGQADDSRLTMEYPEFLCVSFQLLRRPVAQRPVEARCVVEFPDAREDLPLRVIMGVDGRHRAD